MNVVCETGEETTILQDIMFCIRKKHEMIKAKSLVRPFLKWVGGKRQLLASIAEHLPEQMNELRQLQLESLLTFSLRGFRETFGNDGCSYFYSQLVKDIKNEKTLDSAHLDSAVFL